MSVIIDDEIAPKYQNFKTVHLDNNQVELNENEIDYTRQQGVDRHNNYSFDSTNTYSQTNENIEDGFFIRNNVETKEALEYTFQVKLKRNSIYMFKLDYCHRSIWINNTEVYSEVENVNILFQTNRELFIKTNTEDIIVRIDLRYRSTNSYGYQYEVNWNDGIPGQIMEVQLFQVFTMREVLDLKSFKMKLTPELPDRKYGILPINYEALNVYFNQITQSNYHSILFFNKEDFFAAPGSIGEWDSDYGWITTPNDYPYEVDSIDDNRERTIGKMTNRTFLLVLEVAMPM